MADESPYTVGGVLEVKISGDPVSVEATLTLGLGTKMREGTAGATGGGGPRVAWKIPFVELAAHEFGTTHAPEDFEAIVDETVVVRLLDGREYAWYHAWCTMAPDEDALAGTGTVRFECRPRDLKRLA